MTIKKLMKNKKGFEGILFFVIALIVILMIGVLASVAVGLFTYTSDQVTPIFAEIGVVNDDVNMSEIASYTITPANNFVQTLPWLIGFGYVIMLIISMVFVITYESNPHPAFMGAYIFFVILLIFAAMIISNVYEEIYSGSDELSTELHDQTALSYMILFSPAILTLIAMVTGIFLFARPKEVGGGM